MFALDPKLQAQLQPHIGCVLILEDNPNYARLLTDMFRMLGSENVVVERSDALAINRVEEFNPQIIVTEYMTPEINGLEFTRRLRRTRLSARKVPVIMVKGDITATHLKLARNAGVHEVLKRPFAWQDLLTRLRNVLFKSRDWIDAAAYVGPDRRRFNSGGDYTGARKRKGEVRNTAQIAVEEAVRVMKTTLDKPNLSPDDLHKTLLHQMAIIVPKAKQIAAPDFVQTVGQMVAEMRVGNITPAHLGPLIASMMQQLDMPANSRMGWVSRILDEEVAPPARSSKSPQSSQSHAA